MPLLRSLLEVLYGTTCVVLGFLVVVAAISTMLWTRRTILRERILVVRRERDRLRDEVRALLAPPEAGPFRTADEPAEEDLEEDEPVVAEARTAERLELAARGSPGILHLFRYAFARVTAPLDLEPTEDDLHRILRRARGQRRRLLAKRDALLASR